MHWMIYIFLNVNDMFIYIKRKSINVHKHFITVYELYMHWMIYESYCYLFPWDPPELTGGETILMGAP
jgi:hypothetical protein